MAEAKIFNKQLPKLQSPTYVSHKNLAPRQLLGRHWIQSRRQNSFNMNRRSKLGYCHDVGDRELAHPAHYTEKISMDIEKIPMDIDHD